MRTLIVSLFLVAAAGCRPSFSSGGSAATHAAPRIDGTEARRLVGAGALLLDVRTPEEFADGHVEGAKNLPLDRIADEKATLPRDRPIVVYCAVGSRATAAAQLLARDGFDVKNLGPMSAWSR